MNIWANFHYILAQLLSNTSIFTESDIVQWLLFTRCLNHSRSLLDLTLSSISSLVFVPDFSSLCFWKTRVCYIVQQLQTQGPFFLHKYETYYILFAYIFLRTVCIWNFQCGFRSRFQITMLLNNEDLVHCLSSTNRVGFVPGFSSLSFWTTKICAALFSNCWSRVTSSFLGIMQTRISLFLNLAQFLLKQTRFSSPLNVN